MTHDELRCEALRQAMQGETGHNSDEVIVKRAQAFMKFLSGSESVAPVKSNIRELTGHKVNQANDVLTVLVVDQPGSGGACHRYEISGFDAKKNPSADLTDSEDLFTSKTILFQNGPINEVGVNGVTHEVLLAILIDRMDGFQSGPYACEENANALNGLLAAQGWLRRRTENRLERGVEGTHTV